MGKLNGHDLTKISKEVKHLGGSEVPPHIQQQLDDLTTKRSELIVEAVCRLTGRTDYKVEEYSKLLQARGKFRPYDDESVVFEFDGKDALLFEKIVEFLPDQLGQKVEWLFNRDEYEHHTAEDEKS